MQNYYGMTIRQNSNDLFPVRKSVIATLIHNMNFDDAETRHMYCSKNIDSWCKNQKDIVTEEKTYKDHVTLPFPIKNRSTEALLSKCLDGLTQNNNESLNALIWKKCSKDIIIRKKRKKVVNLMFLEVISLYLRKL